MAITAYAFPVLYDVSFPGTARTPKTDQHGIFIIEYEDGGDNSVQGFLLNRNLSLRGYEPHILNPADYNAHSWLICNLGMSRAGLEYTEGLTRVQIKPLPLNSPIGKVIRHEYNDIPLKTIRNFNHENNYF